MAQPRYFRFIVQALLGLLLLAWLPVIGNAPESPFLPQLEETLSLSDGPGDGETDRDACHDRWGDGDGPFPLNVACRLLARVSGRAISQGTPDTVVDLTLLEAWRATGPPALDL